MGSRVDLVSVQWVSVKDRLPKCDTRPDRHGVAVLIWPPYRNATAGVAGHDPEYQPYAFFGTRVSSDPWFYYAGASLPRVEYWAEMPAGPTVT